MELQHSQYNYFVDRDNIVIGYNARTGVFALIASDIADVLRGKGRIENIRDVEELIKKGFLHYGDEFDYIIARFNQQRNMLHLLHLTLVPTLTCNLACDYCFQKEYRSARVMSSTTQEAALRYAESLIEEGRKEVLCNWFGGEPLICKNIVLNMSGHLRRIVDKAGGQLQMSIITNGVMLDGKTVIALAKAGITSAQVTFDALRNQGNHRRGVIDSSNEPSLILKNVIAAREHIEVQIRINVSRDNIDDVPQIIKVLEAHGLEDTFILARVHDYACSHGRSMTCLDYASLEREMLLTCQEGILSMTRKLKPKGHFCSATAGHMFVIDPDGYISRCWHSAGSPSEAMGSVYNVKEPLCKTPIAKRWQNYTPFDHHKCSMCKVLPLCMGGCSHPRLFMNTFNTSCESIKHQIQFCVEQVAARIEINSKQRELVS